MGEPNLAARIRDRDLAVVHVAGEHEVEPVAFEPVEDPRIVAKENPKIRGSQQGIRRQALPYRYRREARDPHTTAAKLDERTLVNQKPGRLELSQIRCTG
jgi:hypothetical protein